MEEKIKELQAQLEKTFRERVELKDSYDRLCKDYVSSKNELQDARRLNERYLKIIENLTEGE